MIETECGADISTTIANIAKNFSVESDLWFRGQLKHRYKLLPSLFRQGEGYEDTYNEHGMYEEFIRRHPEHNSSHRCVTDWLTLMQHFGIPTRLLDWTSNLLVALYFACVEYKEEDGALFVLDPKPLRSFDTNGNLKLIDMQVLSPTRAGFYDFLIYRNEGMFNDDTLINGRSIKDIKFDPLLQVKFNHRADREIFTSLNVKIEMPDSHNLNTGQIANMFYSGQLRAFSNIIPLNHAHLNERSKRQQSFFTLHGGKYFDGAEFIKVESIEAHPYLEGKVAKYQIRQEAKEKILRELKTAGVCESTLFPEMQYQAKDIRAQFTKTWRIVQVNKSLHDAPLT